MLLKVLSIIYANFIYKKYENDINWNIKFNTDFRNIQLHVKLVHI